MSSKRRDGEIICEMRKYLHFHCVCKKINKYFILIVKEPPILTTPTEQQSKQKINIHPPGSKTMRNGRTARGAQINSPKKTMQNGRTRKKHTIALRFFRLRYLHFHECFHDWKKSNNFRILSNDYKLFLYCHENELKSMQSLHLQKNTQRGVQTHTVALWFSWPMFECINLKLHECVYD
jgi:hypothetical protein